MRHALETYTKIRNVYFFMVQQLLVGQGLLSIEASRSHSHTPRSVGLPLACRRDQYLTTQNTPKTQTTMPPAEIEPAILANERPQTLALGRAATGIVAMCNIRRVFLLVYLHFC
jgi:hypothetical protein